MGEGTTEETSLEAFPKTASVGTYMWFCGRVVGLNLEEEDTIVLILCVSFLIFLFTYFVTNMLIVAITVI